MAKRTILAIFATLAGVAPGYAQTAAPLIPAAAVPLGAVTLPRVPGGTQISLMGMNEVTTKRAKAGDRFPLRLDRPVIIDGRVVIKEGAAAVGEVISAKESGIAGKSGKLATRLVHLEVDGMRLPISGDPRQAGQGGNLQIVLATLALTPWGLFARGNNAKLKAGDIVTGVLVDEYTPPGSADPASATAPAATTP